MCHVILSSTAVMSAIPRRLPVWRLRIGQRRQWLSAQQNKWHIMAGDDMFKMELSAKEDTIDFINCLAIPLIAVEDMLKLGEKRHGPATPAQLARDFFNEGVFFLDYSRLDEAIDVLTKAIALCPMIPNPWGNRALCHGKKGNFESALGDCSKALCILYETYCDISNASPCAKDVRILHNIGCICSNALGLHAGALVHFVKGMALGRTDPFFEVILSRKASH